MCSIACFKAGHIRAAAPSVAHLRSTRFSQGVFRSRESPGPYECQASKREVATATRDNPATGDRRCPPPHYQAPHTSLSTIHPSPIHKIKPLTSLLLIAFLLLFLNLDLSQYMLPLRNLLAGLSGRSAASTMAGGAKKSPPPPTVPAAIQSASNLSPGEGGETFSLRWR